MHDGDHSETGDERDRHIGRRALAVHAEAIDAFSDGEREWIAATGDDWQDDVPVVGAVDGDAERGDAERGGDGSAEVRRPPTDRYGDPPAE